MTEVIMPKMGDGMEEGTLLEWLKRDGDKVKSGEIIGTIQTDKATLELESPGSGILSGILIETGVTVPVGKPIAAILKEGESLPQGWGGGNGAASAPEAKTEPAPAKPAPTEQAAAAAPAQAAPKAEAVKEEPAEPAGRVKASPLARKIAEERGVDLASLKGSGPGGRIVEKDIPEAPAKRATPAAAAEDRTLQLNRLRQITAQRTAQSKAEVPHFYVTVEVDVERLSALREMFEEEESGKVSINDFVVKALALALQDMPEVNAVYQGQSLLVHGAINIGIAAAIDEGLTVPVMKNVQSMSLREIAAASRDLVGRARENKLSLDELSGSTFSISNMGMLDVDNFLAIVNQPNSGILAISTVRKRVVATDEDEIEIRRKMNLSASFDHRVVDGAIGARFVNVVRQYLENPTRLLG